MRRRKLPCRGPSRSASLIRQHPDQPDSRLELALGRLELEALYRKTGRIAEAEQEHGRAVDELTKLRDDFPEVGEYRQRLASAHRDQAVSLLKMGGPGRRRPRVAWRSGFGSRS